MLHRGGGVMVLAVSPHSCVPFLADEMLSLLVEAAGKSIQILAVFISMLVSGFIDNINQYFGYASQQCACICGLLY